jgi:hypothetical protein
MEKYGDPNWSYHLATTKLWALAAARLVESPVIAFSAGDYAVGLDSYLQTVKPSADKLPKHAHFDFDHLDRAISNFQAAATAFDVYAASLAEKLDEDVPWYHWWKKVRLYFLIRGVNDKYKYLERSFLYQPGLDGRNWFKHVVFAPGIWTGYSGATYPGLVESLDDGDVENAKVSDNFDHMWDIFHEERTRLADCIFFTVYRNGVVLSRNGLVLRPSYCRSWSRLKSEGGLGLSVIGYRLPGQFWGVYEEYMQ